MRKAPAHLHGFKAMRWRIQHHVFLRTSAHIVLWVGFGVVLAVVPFAIAWLNHNPDRGITWLQLVPTSDLILISIALAAGAFGDLLLRTFLAPELTLKIGTKVSYPLILGVVGFGTYMYATISENGQEESGTSLGWTVAIVAASLGAAAFTITVNERAELYVRNREEAELENATRDLENVTKALTTANEELTRLRNLLPTVRHTEAEYNGQTKVVPVGVAITQPNSSSARPRETHGGARH